MKCIAPTPPHRAWGHNYRQEARMGVESIPQRQNPDRRPSPKVRAVAARVRVNADRRVGKITPAWIITLSQSPAGR